MAPHVRRPCQLPDSVCYMWKCLVLQLSDDVLVLQCQSSVSCQRRPVCATRPRFRQNLHPVRNDTGKNLERAFLGEV